MHRLFLYFGFLSLAFVNISGLIHYTVVSQGKVLGETSTVPAYNLELPEGREIVTKTNFLQKEIEENETIPFETIYEKDSSLEYGVEEVHIEGVNGNIRRKFIITYWQDEEFYRNLASTEVTNPVTQVVARGTKVVWREVDTELGKLKYWYKLNVWATKYDGNCVGCRGLTYSGTKVRKGVCAVDPKVIPLGTNFYVEGYGMCRSEDIGGAIKGNKVDLGYEDVTKGSWRTGYTNVYLLTSAPE